MEGLGDVFQVLFQIPPTVQALQHEFQNLLLLLGKVPGNQLGPEIVGQRFSFIGADIPAVLKIVLIIIVLALIKIIIFLIKRIKPLALFDGFRLPRGGGGDHVDHRIFQGQFVNVCIQFLRSHLKNLGGLDHALG